MKDEFMQKAKVLIEALPYIQSFYDKTVVIKYGGAAMTDKSIRKAVLNDIVFLNYVGMQPILVHGGGPFISNRMRELGKEVKFVRGYRVTDEEAIEVAGQELTRINREIVSEITSLGGSAISLSGVDDRLIEVKKHADIDGEDIGYVGEITKINGDILQRMLTTDIIPVVAPLGIGARDGFTYNVNADQVAAEVARSLGALKLVLLTDVRGIMRDLQDPSSLVTHATVAQAEALIKEGVVEGGMIPKVNACIRALDRGVKKAHIIDVKVPHGILLEMFTDEGIGTEMVKR